MDHDDLHMIIFDAMDNQKSASRCCCLNTDYRLIGRL